MLIFLNLYCTHRTHSHSLTHTRTADIGTTCTITATSSLRSDHPYALRHSIDSRAPSTPSTHRPYPSNAVTHIHTLMEYGVLSILFAVFSMSVAVDRVVYYGIIGKSIFVTSYAIHINMATNVYIEAIVLNYITVAIVVILISHACIVLRSRDRSLDVAHNR